MVTTTAHVELLPRLAPTTASATSVRGLDTDAPSTWLVAPDRGPCDSTRPMASLSSA